MGAIHDFEKEKLVIGVIFHREDILEAAMHDVCERFGKIDMISPDCSFSDGYSTYYDDELGMYYLQSRYYDPNTGRFINADDASMLGTSGTVLGYNLFSYCENNPVNILDESGYVGVPWQVKIGIAAGVASAIWEMGKYIAGHRDQKVTSWAYIKGLGTALIKGFVRGFVVGVISTIPKNLAYGLLGGSVYLIHGLVTGSVKTVGQGVSAFMNGWTNGVYTKTLNNMLGNLGRLTGWSSGAMDKLEYITSTFLGFGLSRFFVW